MRRFFVPAAFTAALAFGLADASPVRAQAPRNRPLTVPSVAAQSVNPNPLIAPGLTLQQYAYNTKVMGRALATVPPYALGYNPYPPVINYGPAYGAYANPYAAYGNPYFNPFLSSYTVSPYPSVLPNYP
jgi:hypothetical protein